MNSMPNIGPKLTGTVQEAAGAGAQNLKKTQILKQREKSQLIPVVLISSKDEPELQRLVIEARADGCLPKPFTADALVNKVKQFLIP